MFNSQFSSEETGKTFYHAVSSNENWELRIEH
jgi:hypothetical protein